MRWIMWEMFNKSPWPENKICLDATSIFIDRSAANSLSMNKQASARTKHIDLDYYIFKAAKLSCSMLLQIIIRHACWLRSLSFLPWISSAKLPILTEFRRRYISLGCNTYCEDVQVTFIVKIHLRLILHSHVIFLLMLSTSSRSRTSYSFKLYVLVIYGL